MSSVDHKRILSAATPHPTVSAKNILMLFAPKFDHFGCDVARAFIAENGCGRVHGLCTGSRAVHEHVAAELGTFGGRFWWLENEEMTWLATPAPTDQLQAIERELGPGIFGRIVTADRRVGRGFVRGGLTRPDRIGRQVALDPAAAAQRYVNGLYRFLVEVFSETEPDIVFCYAVAGAPAVALAEMCRMHAVPFRVLTYTRIGDGHVCDEDPLGRLPFAARRFKRARDGNSPFTPSALAAAREYLKAFRASPVAPKSMAVNSTPSNPLSALTAGSRSLLFLMLFCLKEACHGRRPGVDATRQLFKVWITLRRQILRIKQVSLREPLPQDFIYFPLHVDPEASTMVLSPYHTDQLSIIEALAKSAPAHLRIVVKEHVPMLGLRPRGYYRAISRMPRVMLVDPHQSSFDLITESALIATITGTAAWEAILLGRPALIVGDSPFLPIGEGFVYEQDLTCFPQAIESALNTPPASDDILECYIAALQSNAFEFPMSLLWGDYAAHSADQRYAVSKTIANEIARSLEDVPADMDMKE